MRCQVKIRKARRVITGKPWIVVYPQGGVWSAFPSWREAFDFAVSGRMLKRNH